MSKFSALLKYLSFIFIFAGLCLASPSQASMRDCNHVLSPDLQQSLQKDFSLSHLNDLRELTDKILEHYPLDQNILLTIGGSTTAIQAELQARNLLAHHLPISRLREHSAINLEKAKTQSYMRELDFHMRRFLPKASEVQSKRIVIVDYALSGKSLITLQKYLQNYYMTNEGLGVNIEILPIIGLTRPNIRETRPPLNLQILKAPYRVYTHSVIEEFLYLELYDRYRLYSSFEIKFEDNEVGSMDLILEKKIHSTWDLNPRPEFSALVRYFQENR